MWVKYAQLKLGAFPLLLLYSPIFRDKIRFHGLKSTDIHYGYINIFTKVVLNCISFSSKKHLFIFILSSYFYSSILSFIFNTVIGGAAKKKDKLDGESELSTEPPEKAKNPDKDGNVNVESWKQP